MAFAAMAVSASRRGLFVGLTTWDVLYRVPAPPAANQKIVASETLLAAGGPATNAAIAFQHWGNQATVLSVIGGHPLRSLIEADLQTWNVAIADLQPENSTPPPLSSVLVSAATGDRAVVSMNAVGRQAAVADIPPDISAAIQNQQFGIVLIDGHQMAVGSAIAIQARDRQIPVVIDAGSWKSGFEPVLAQAEVVICSANFYPPGCTTPQEVMAYLSTLGVPHIAISRGAEPILYATATETQCIPVPQVTVTDTLGAGDTLHGAFCHFYPNLPVPEALAQAGAIASRSCQFFGPRQWMLQS
jgi:sugar/nucleoside kinase (ribokinase family)